MSNRPLKDEPLPDLLLRGVMLESMLGDVVHGVVAPVVNWLITGERAANPGKWLERVQSAASSIAQRTGLPLFFGGVGVEANIATAQGLMEENKGVIIDFCGAEGLALDGEKTYDNALEGYMKSLDICGELARENTQKKLPLAAAFKFSTIASVEDLRAISELLEDQPDQRQKPEFNDRNLETRYDAIYNRAKDFFARATQLGIEAFADAEQSYINPAIHHICERLQREDNAKISWTVQAYLKDSEALVDRILAQDPAPNVKLVRGAYMNRTETNTSEVAADDGVHEIRNRIWPSKQECDKNYDHLLEKLYKAGKIKHLTVATHNQESRDCAQKLVTASAAQDGTTAFPKITFATLLGMGNTLKKPASSTGIVEAKYQPALLDERAAAVLSAIAYFSRRVTELTTPDQETGLASAQKELNLIKEELQTRTHLPNWVMNVFNRVESAGQRWTQRIVTATTGQGRSTAA